MRANIGVFKVIIIFVVFITQSEVFSWVSTVDYFLSEYAKLLRFLKSSSMSLVAKLLLISSTMPMLSVLTRAPWSWPWLVWPPSFRVCYRYSWGSCRWSYLPHNIPKLMPLLLHLVYCKLVTWWLPQLPFQHFLLLFSHVSCLCTCHCSFPDQFAFNLRGSQGKTDHVCDCHITCFQSYHSFHGIGLNNSNIFDQLFWQVDGLINLNPTFSRPCLHASSNQLFCINPDLDIFQNDVQGRDVPLDTPQRPIKAAIWKSVNICFFLAFTLLLYGFWELLCQVPEHLHSWL